jgi:hypothetical protein
LFQQNQPSDLSATETNEGLFTYGGSAFNALGELAAPCSDRVNWHEYYNDNPPEVPLTRDLATHRDLLDSRFAGSYGTSLYMTETAYCAFSPGPLGHRTELQQAQWAVREYLVTLRGSFLDLDNKAYWYYYLDDNGAPYYASAMSGLLRIDMSSKPSYVAMRALAPLMEGAEPVGELDLGDPLHVLVMRRGAEPVLALWGGDEAGEVALEVGRPRVTLVDFFGNRREALTQAGKVRLLLSGSPQYVFGADPAAVFGRALADHLDHLAKQLSKLQGPEDVGGRARSTPRHLALVASVRAEGHQRYRAVPSGSSQRKRRAGGWRLPSRVTEGMGCAA